jgi:hypothetical protein
MKWRVTFSLEKRHWYSLSGFSFLPDQPQMALFSALCEMKEFIHHYGHEFRIDNRVDPAVGGYRNAMSRASMLDQMAMTEVTMWQTNATLIWLP